MNIRLRLQRLERRLSPQGQVNPFRLRILKTPKKIAAKVEPQNGRGQISEGVEDEIRRLEKRRRELRERLKEKQ